MGFTFVNLKKISKALFKDALTTAYFTKAPTKLAAVYFPN
jgi:hypothetical protein